MHIYFIFLKAIKKFCIKSLRVATSKKGMQFYKKKKSKFSGMMNPPIRD